MDSAEKVTVQSRWTLQKTGTGVGGEGRNLGGLCREEGRGGGGEGRNLGGLCREEGRGGG